MSKLVRKRFKDKDIIPYLSNLGYNLNNISNAKIKSICNFINENKILDDNYITSEITIILLNDIKNLGKIKEFKNKTVMCRDCYDNFYFYNLDLKDYTHYLINDSKGRYDLDKFIKGYVTYIDIPIIYYNNSFHALWIDLYNHIPENIIDNIQIEVINGDTYYLTPLIKFENIFRTKALGKDWIKHYIFNESNIDGILYFLKIKQNNKIFYKVGITKNSINERFRNVNFEILEKQEIKMNMLKCCIIEKYFHENYIELKETNLNEKFEGSTECYIKDMFQFYNDDILDKALNHLDNINYSLSSNIIKLFMKEKGII